MRARATIAMLMLFAPASQAQESALDPLVGEVLKRASDHLTAAETLGVNAVINFEVFMANGHKIQLERRADILLKRPNKLRGDVSGDVPHRRVYYDGKTVTVYHLDMNVYARIKAPNNIDAMADMLHDKFDISAPLIDVLVADPYASYKSAATYSDYIGLHDVNGEQCHHLLLSNSEIDYQIWISAGPAPLIRKIVIDYVEEPGVPQFAALFGEWDMGAEISDTMFEFSPPEDADEIDILPLIQQPEVKQ